MSITLPPPPGTPGTQEAVPITEQYAIVRRLLAQWEKFQNVCTASTLSDGQYQVHIESFVFELEGWIVNSQARLVPYVLELVVDSPPVSFHYLSPLKLPDNIDVNFDWKEKVKDDVPRIVLPVARIKASPWTTFVRPNHLYYSTNGPEMWVSEAIIALKVIGGIVTDQNRYFPIDCASELVSNIANWDPMNPCILRTFDITALERTTKDVIKETAAWVEWIKDSPS